jgi:hypothetical protein
VIKRFRFRDRQPMADLDGIDTFTWWTTNLAGLVRIVRAAGFSRVEPEKPFELQFSGDSSWQGLRGAVSAFV